MKKKYLIKWINYLIDEMMETLSLKYRDIFLYLYLNPAINEGFV